MIDYDASRRPGRTSEWVALLNAIYNAKSNDESQWMEWKSSYDWDNKSHRAALSRAIIAFANRDPLDVAAYLDGSAVIVVGLEPGAVHGVKAVDSAILEDKLDAYLGGADGPRWEPHWLQFDGYDVLVIEIPPPRPGDPPYVLTSGSNDFKAGQVFVRMGAKSVPATPADLRRLGARFATPSERPVLNMLVRIEDVESFPTFAWEESDIDAFIESESSRTLASLDSARQPTRASDGHDSDLRRLTEIRLPALGARPEERTEDEYRAQVESYVDRVRESLPNILFEVGASVIPAPAFYADNLGSNNLKDIHVTLTVSGDAHVRDKSDDWSLLKYRLPERPRSFGPWMPDFGPFGAGGPVYLPQPPLPFDLGRRSLHNGGSFTIECDAFHLRPNQTGVLVEEEAVFLIPASRSGTVEVHWKATTSNVDAIAEGTINLDFSGPTFDLFQASQTPERPDDGE